jgi:hypothetical protein
MSRSSTASSTALTDRGECHGVTVFAGMLLGKRLDLLPSWFPKCPSLEILVNPDAADAEPEIGEVTAAAQTLGRRIQVLSASGDAAIETAFATLAERESGGSSSVPMLSSPTAESKLLHWRHGVWSLRCMDGANTSSAGFCELRNQSCRRILAGWRLHRPDSPRREARRFAVIQPTRFELVRSA